MKLTLNKIKALEAKARKIQAQKDSKLKLKVPKNWKEFVRLTTIRSGGDMVTFNPYYYQQVVSDLMDTYNNIICVKSRQLGLTQIILSKFLHRACTNQAYSAMCFLRNADDAGAISRRARQMLSGINDYVTPDNENVGHLKLKNLGEIYFKNSSREGSKNQMSSQ